MLTQDQRRQQATSIEMMMEACTGIDSGHILIAVEAMLEARPDLHATHLEAFAQRMSRRADDMERKSR